jgi:lipopolysaccharide export system permease protein
MGSIGRYIFRTAFGAFLLVLISLTIAVWLTQALRDIDLMTSQGQTILMFVGITSLIIPLLILVITPIALVIAVSHLLHKLNNDSEIIVMNGAGMQPWQLFMPFAVLSLVVTVMLAIVNAYVAPQGLRMLRDRIVEARADLLSNLVQPGRFIAIDRGLAFHIRERRPNGLLVGIMVDDRRDEKERVTILAEQGEILKTERGSFLLMENGSIQRQEQKSRDPNIVRFERYAFDLSRFVSGPLVIKYSVRERYLWQLMWPDPGDQLYKEQANQFWTELNDRILALFYPFTFVVIAYVFLGAPRTTRQSTAWSILAVIVSVSTLRLIGLAGTILTNTYPKTVAIQYFLIAGTLSTGLYAISKGLIIEPPVYMTRAMDAVTAWFQRRVASIMEPAQ